MWLSRGEHDHRSPPVCDETKHRNCHLQLLSLQKPHPCNGGSSPGPPAPVLTSDLHPTPPAKHHHPQPCRFTFPKDGGQVRLGNLLFPSSSPCPRSLIHSICFSLLFICFSSTALNQGGNSSLTNIYRLSNHNCRRRQGQ